jgi:hypothetical protein
MLRLFNKMAKIMSVGTRVGFLRLKTQVGTQGAPLIQAAEYFRRPKKDFAPYLKRGAHGIELKSLIMAQIERWRYA